MKFQIKLSAMSLGDFLGNFINVKKFFSSFFDRLAGPDTDLAGNRLCNQLESLFYRLFKFHEFQNIFFIVRMLFIYLISLLITPICFLLNKIGFIFLSIKLDQVGDVQFLDAAIKKELLNNRKYNKFFFLVPRPKCHLANNYILDLYSPYVTYIKNPILRFVLSPFFLNPFFNSKIFEFDPCYSWNNRNMTKKTFYYETINNYEEKFNTILPQISDEEFQKAAVLLKPLFDISKPFVALHVRDSGLYKDFNRTTRNGNIKDYDLAIDYLIDKGFNIVRMGHASAVDITDFVKKYPENFIDYAKYQHRSDFLDSIIISKCTFFIGGASGFYALASVFNKPLCLVNFYSLANCLGTNQYSLTAFKKIRKISDNSLLSLFDYLRDPFISSPQLTKLKDLGYYLEDNSPEEIYLTIYEFLNPTKTNELARMARLIIYESMFMFEAKGNFSNVMLKQYIRID